LKFRIASVLTATLLSVGLAQAATELVIATVNNGHMIEMQKLSKNFEAANPDIKLKWVTLEEGVLRQRVTTDIATKGGQFDVMTIGMYETPIWGKKGWLQELKTDANYDVDDLLPAMRNGLSVDGKLFAAPFYGESSMLMYRKDLADKAGVQVPERPTWPQIKELAAKIHDPKNGVYGICLRGKPGWGDNMAFLSTLVNTFGGQWFDMGWKPQLESKPWKDAVNFYVDLLKNYGPPGSSSNSFNEILALTNSGKCGMWIDATIAASFVSDPKQSKVAAVAEGVALGLCDGLQAFGEPQRMSQRLSLVGGGSRSAWWAQLLADALNTTLTMHHGAHEGAALGAARLAWLATGASEQAVCVVPPVSQTFVPQADSSAKLRERHARFTRTAQALMPWMVTAGSRGWAAA